MSSMPGRPQRESFLERHHFVTFVMVALTGLGVTTLSIKDPQRTRHVQDAGTRILGPLARAGSGASKAGRSAWESVSLTWTAKEELALARTRVEELQLRSTDREELARENERLLALLELKQALPRTSVPARIVYQERGPDWVLLIDRGTDDGIAADMSVISPEGVVGKVLDATGSMARVQALLDGNAGIAVAVGDQRRQINAIVTSGAGDTFRLQHVDLLVDVSPGDRVITSGLDKIYPKGLLVGTVSNVDGAGTLEQEIVVRPAVDFGRLEEVLVLGSNAAMLEESRRQRDRTADRPVPKSQRKGG